MSTERLPLAGRVELAQTMGSWLFEGSAVSAEGGPHPWRREDTRLSFEDEDHLWRWVAGDLSGAATGFQERPSMAGLSWRRDFTASPERTARRLNEHEIFLRRDSSIEVWKDGAFYAQIRVPAGSFDLREDPLLSGLDRVVLRVRDDLGQEEVFEFDPLAEVRLLFAGDNEFSYDVGFPWRESGGDRAYDSRAAFTSLVHRHGFGDRVTVGLNYQNWYYRHLLGFDVSTAGAWGFFSLEGAASMIAETGGGAGRLRWNSVDRLGGLDPSWRLGLEYERRSDTFFPVRVTPLTPSSYETRSEAQIRKSFGWRYALMVGAGQETAFGGEATRKTARGGFNFSMAGGWTMSANYERSTGAAPEERGVVSLSWTEDPRRFSVSGTYHGPSDVSAVRVSRESSRAESDLRVRAIAGGEQRRSWQSAQLEGLSRLGTVGVDGFHSELRDARSSNVSLSTGMAWGEGGLEAIRTGVPSGDEVRPFVEK